MIIRFKNATCAICVALLLISCSSDGSSTPTNNGNATDTGNVVNETESGGASVEIASRATVESLMITAADEAWDCTTPSQPGTFIYLTIGDSDFSNANSFYDWDGDIESYFLSFNWDFTGTEDSPSLNVRGVDLSFVLFDFRFSKDSSGRDTFTASDSRGFDMSCTRRFQIEL